MKTTMAMTENEFYRLGVANRYIGMLSTNSKAIETQVEQLRQLKKLDKDQKRLFEKMKQDLARTRESIKLWQSVEDDIIEQFFGEEFVIPKY